jgi:hypothetical protein
MAGSARSFTVQRTRIRADHRKNAVMAVPERALEAPSQDGTGGPC